MIGFPSTAIGSSRVVSGRLQLGRELPLSVTKMLETRFGPIQPKWTEFKPLDGVKLSRGPVQTVRRRERRGPLCAGQAQTGFVSINPNIHFYVVGQSFQKLQQDSRPPQRNVSLLRHAYPHLPRSFLTHLRALGKADHRRYSSKANQRERLLQASKFSKAASQEPALFSHSLGERISARARIPDS